MEIVPGIQTCHPESSLEVTGVRTCQVTACAALRLALVSHFTSCTRIISSPLLNHKTCFVLDRLWSDLHQIVFGFDARTGAVVFHRIPVVAEFFPASVHAIPARRVTYPGVLQEVAFVDGTGDRSFHQHELCPQDTALMEFQVERRVVLTDWMEFQLVATDGFPPWNWFQDELVVDDPDSIVSQDRPCETTTPPAISVCHRVVAVEGMVVVDFQDRPCVLFMVVRLLPVFHVMPAVGLISVRAIQDVLACAETPPGNSAFQVS